MIVHSLTEALAASAAADEAGRPVRLVSAPAAASSAGPGWFSAVVKRARERHKNAVADAVLDCGVSAGAAMAAIRHGGIDALVVRVRPLVAKKLEAIGAARKIVVLARPPAPALDLLDAADPARACREWLETHRPRP